MALRVRVESAPPLPPLKAWFAVGAEMRTVDDLAGEVLERLGASAGVALLLDGFELFGSSPLRDVVRDGELITVRLARESAKRPAEAEAPRPRKRAKLAHKPAPAHKPVVLSDSNSSSSSSSSSSGSSSSSSDSDSDSSSSDSDTSSSDSSSSSDSDSDSDAPPTVLPLRALPPKPAAASKPTHTALLSLPVPLPTPPSAPPVPPGHGKPTTQSRNARRRKKRAFDAAAATPAPAPGTSAANATPLGAPAAEVVEEVQAEAGDGGEGPLMLSMGNKNKRRGFKRAMAGASAQHITFADPDAPPLPTPSLSTAAPAKHARLVPPSEKAALGLLPPRMFVTSVDVEAGLWPAQKKRKKKMRDAWGVDEENFIPTGRDGGAGGQAWEEGESGLDYGEETGRVAREVMSRAVKEEMLDWAALEKAFDAAPPATPSTLSPGRTVAWKEFGVHPLRLTPEMVVHAAVVCALDRDRGVVTVRVAKREAAFGAMDFEEGEGGADVDVEEVEYALGAIDGLGWRLM